MKISARILISIVLIIGIIVGLQTFRAQQVKISNNSIAAKNFESKINKTQALSKQFLIDRDIEKANEIESEFELLREQIANPEKELERELAKKLEVYIASFMDLKISLIKRGLDANSGIEGEFRKAVHEVEDRLNKFELDKVKIAMLMARRSEKDFIMRLKPKYIGRVENSVDEIIERIKKSNIPDASKDSIIKGAKIYKEDFLKLKDIFFEIKNNTEILDKNLENINAVTELLVANADQEVKTYEDLSIYVAFVSILIAMLVFFLLYRDQAVLAKGFDSMKKAMVKVKEGNLKARAEETGSKKVQELVKDFNDLISRTEKLFNETSENAQKALEKEQNLKACIERILAKLKKVAHGDLTVQIDEDDEEELIRVLSQGITHLLNNLAQIISHIADVTQTSNELTKTLIDSSKISEERAIKQSENTLRIGDAIVEVTDTINENVELAGSASEFSLKSSEVAKNGGTIVNNTKNKIGEVNGFMQEFGESISELDSEANKIGDVTKVINDIASQTNMLALNAAIEAARAGTYGKGFAVVAEEVRKLADKTTDATSKISTMINAIQSKTDNVVRLIDSGKQKVDESLELGVEADKAINTIIKHSHELNEILNRITDQSIAQADKSAFIKSGIQDISEESQLTKTEVVNVSNCVNELSEISHSLYESVKEFKLEHQINKQKNNNPKKIENKESEAYLLN